MNLGTTEVVDDACMVRMHVVGSGGNGTYTYEDDYTEYDISPEGQLYAREGDIAIYAEGGWQEFPPRMEQMMVGSLGDLPLGPRSRTATSPPPACTICHGGCRSTSGGIA